MAETIRQKGISLMDDAMTLGGRVAPRAREVAQIASRKDIEERIVRYRWGQFGLAMLNLTLSGIKTHGAFSIGSGGEVEYAGARILSALTTPFRRQANLDYYESIYDEVYDSYFSIPLEVRSKLEEHLVQSGIPENKVGQWAVTSAVLNVRNDRPVEQMAITVLSPLVQAWAASERIPVSYRIGMCGLAYMGFLFGPKFSKITEKLNFEWNTIRTTTKASKENGGIMGARVGFARRWAKDNLTRYKKYDFIEDMFRGFPDIVGALAVLGGKGKDVFGRVTLVSESMSGFLRSLDLYNDIRDSRITSKMISEAAKFLLQGGYLANEDAWDRFRKEESCIDNQKLAFRQGEVLRMDSFSSKVGVAKSVDMTGSLWDGSVHFVDGQSGDGKSIFLYALRGLARSEGEAWMRQGESLINIRAMKQTDLAKKIVYFSPGDRNGKGLRTVDIYTDGFVECKLDTLNKMKKEVLRALLIEDGLLERILVKIWSKRRDEWKLGAAEDYSLKELTEVNGWEDGLFGEIEKIDFEQIAKLRIDKIRFAEQRMVKLGKNMNFHPTVPLKDLSTGMKIRVMLDTVMDTNAQLCILDEPFGSIDEETAVEMMTRIALDLKSRDRVLAVAIVSHSHKLQLESVCNQILGEDKVHHLNLRR